MPNYITNRLQINAADDILSEIISTIKGVYNDEDEEIPAMDFNKIIPMPKELDIEEGSCGADGAKYLYLKTKDIMSDEDRNWLLDFEAQNKRLQAECIKLGSTYLNNISKFGHRTWYSWRIANWGTKWNAMNSELINGNVIFFSTAWAGVPDLMRKLSMMFPKAELVYSWADEDTGYNVGQVTFKNGEGKIYIPEGGSKEAFKIALNLNNHYELIDEQNRCIDEYER